MVSVGPGGKLVFEPDNIKAEKGDQIQFNFESSGHSVAYGDFSNACQPSDDKDAFYSGFINSGVSIYVDILFRHEASADLIHPSHGP